MKILLTGSHGYIGSIAAPIIANAGHDVVGLDALLYRGCDFGGDATSPITLERDVRDVEVNELEGFDAIVHLAALSNDPVGDLDPELTASINGTATVRLARLAREAGVRRFVFASSCSMYGAAGEDDILDEDAPLRPLTAYAESKVRSEEGIFELSGADFAPVSMRNATVFGVSPRLRLDIVLNNLAAWSHTTGMVRLLSDGRSWRPLIHVRDVSRAMVAMLESPEHVVRGQAFNVGSNDQNYMIRDLAELLSGLTGCAMEFAEGSTPDQRSYRVDFGKLSVAIPGLVFEWDAKRGATELVDAYRRVGLTRMDFEGDRYVRLRRIRALLDRGALSTDLRWRDETAD
jgi:nucleoside-diphosphate-sugar epimerase